MLIRISEREPIFNPLSGVGSNSIIPHEPVYDCEVQAWKVWAHWQDH